MNGLTTTLLPLLLPYEPSATSITGAELSFDGCDQTPSLWLTWRADNGTEGGWGLFGSNAVKAINSILSEIEPRGSVVCGDANGQYKCNIHLGHEGKHMSASNGHVLEAW